MAEKAPQEVVQVFSRMNLGNGFVAANAVDAALVMPAGSAAQLAPRIAESANPQALLLASDKAAELCVRLADSGELNSATCLADALFGRAPAGDGEFPDRHGQYWYTEGLRKVVPKLEHYCGRWLCGRVCRWLAIAVTTRRRFSDASADEYSYIWRPAIEDDQDNSDGDFTSDLVTIVRDALETAIWAGDEISLEDALSLLLNEQSQVHLRLRVHLARMFADQEPAIARAMMMRRDLLEQYAYKHEYALLMKDCWMLLTAEDRTTWLGWVDLLADDIRLGRKWQNQEANERVRADQAAWWKFERLHWIREHLEGNTQAFYERMLANHGAPEMSDSNVRLGPMRWGSESPITVDELRKGSFVNAVDWVASWTPDHRLAMGPEREGLANTFGQYVAENPADFSAQAEVMRGRPPIYVRTFLSKMEEAVKAGQHVDITAILDMCQWVVEQPATKVVDSVRDDVEAWDRGWEWTRGEIARLLEAVCKASAENGPLYPVDQYHEPVWNVLEPLTRDSAETSIATDRAAEDPRAHDYLTAAINSPRGKAMEAAFQYARWVAKSLERPKDGGSFVEGGLRSIPELWSVLEWQIEVLNATVEAFAIIGMNIGLLHWIDKDWLAKNIETIFHIAPYDGSRGKKCGWAAWNAFLVWVAPHVEFYKLLKSQYAYSVEQSANIEVTERSHETPVFRLGEHLMILYGRGHLPLDEEGGLIRQFVENANPKVRRRAFSFIGWSFRQEDTIPSQILDRFMSIWDFYWQNSGKVDAQQSDEDLFGRRFSSGHFSVEWSLRRLHQYVEVADVYEAGDELVKRLADVAATDISTSLSILDAFVHKDNQGWRIHSWSQPAATILKLALKTSGDVANGARSLIDYLGRRGFLQFGDLLSE